MYYFIFDAHSKHDPKAKYGNHSLYKPKNPDKFPEVSSSDHTSYYIPVQYIQATRCICYTFKDSEGRVLLVRSCDGNVFSDTYFVYDSFIIIFPKTGVYQVSSTVGTTSHFGRTRKTSEYVISIR